tara:strand:- start:23418 stop:24770 length:1353 start_codon:yes stop_codon:yes gene_type:complete
MSKQNIGKPRFYVDLAQYLRAVGQVKSEYDIAFYPNNNYTGQNDGESQTNPLWLTDKSSHPDIITHQSPFGLDPYVFRAPRFQQYEAGNVIRYFAFDQDPSLDDVFNPNVLDKVIHQGQLKDWCNYVAVLGHNMAVDLDPNQEQMQSMRMIPFFDSHYSNEQDSSNPMINRQRPKNNGFTNVWGTNQVSSSSQGALQISLEEANGFSICTFDNWQNNSNYGLDGMGAFAHRMGVIITPPPPENYDSDFNVNYRPSDNTMCSISMGRYYDIQSPNMSLTFERDFDGIDTKITRGGSNISNVRYTGAPNWGTGLPSWTPTYRNTISRLNTSGRRTWTLSFDQLGDDELMGAYESISSHPYSLSGYQPNESLDPQDGTTPIRDYYNPLMQDDNLFSQLYVKTLGGTLPFIFDPNREGSNPDRFALCTLKRNSLKISQKSFKRYNIKMDIVESW